MKIYYQYGTSKRLEPDRGDKVNEIGLCLALSTFATVYYSGQVFCPDEANYGLKDYLGEIVVTPGCDWYIIRNNKEVFDRCPGKRIWVSSPYDQDAFRKADLIFAFTEKWANKLKRGDEMSHLNLKGECWPQAVAFRQAVLPHFKYYRLTNLMYAAGLVWGNKKTIGVFGRIAKFTYPTLLLKSLPELYQEKYELLFGSTRVKKGWALPEIKGIVSASFPNELMPRIYNECDVVVVSQWGPEWEFCGNLKTLEPAACGCPVILQRSPAREETLGVDYPFYLEPGVLRGNNTRPLVEMIHKAVQVTPEWRQRLSERVLSRHGVKEVGEYLKQLLTK